MKKLNKKGFTLVELLAVIVVLALLMVVAASSIGSALENSKKKALNIYADRVSEKAKELCMSSYLLDGNSPCTYSSVDAIMGTTDNQFESVGDIVVTITSQSTSSVSITGKIKDSKNESLGTVDLK